MSYGASNPGQYQSQQQGYPPQQYPPQSVAYPAGVPPQQVYGAASYPYGTPQPDSGAPGYGGYSQSQGCYPPQHPANYNRSPQGNYSHPPQEWNGQGIHGPPHQAAPLGQVVEGMVGGMIGVMQGIARGMEAMPHNHHHQLSNSNYVQPGAPPPVVYGGGGGGDECPKCHGKGGIGAFGPCSKGGIHFKKNCALCGGSCLVLRPAYPCPKCNGKGGLGPFGSCHEHDVHFKKLCPACAPYEGYAQLGHGYVDRPNMQPCSACQGKGGNGAFGTGQGPCEVGDVHFRSECVHCRGCGYL